jgi:6-phosphogluconate dehydrogenase
MAGSGERSDFKDAIMRKVKREFGIVGLGRMGGEFALHAVKKGLRVVGYDIRGASEEMVRSGLVPADNLANFREKLTSPRVIFLYIPAGPSVDKDLDSLILSLEKGDLIVDGGNSYWEDSIHRYERLREKGLKFIDVGTAGGLQGAREGACFMVGGNKEDFEYIEPILKVLAAPGGYVHAGSVGAGHFTKLVHNGIEFGMLQSIGEGVDLLENYRYKLEIAEILRCWRNGSVIRSWLIDLMEEAFRDEGGLEHIPPYVEDTGEVNWLINDALKMEVPIPVISQSAIQLFTSRDNRKNWARCIAMMRHRFGGHPYGADEAVARERMEGKIDAPFNDQMIE